MVFENAHQTLVGSLASSTEPGWGCQAIAPPSKQTRALKHKEKRGICWRGWGDGEKPPRIDHSMLLLPRSPLSISVHHRPLAHQLVTSLPSHAAPSSSTAGPSCSASWVSRHLPHGPEQCRVPGLSPHTHGPWCAKDTPLGSHRFRRKYGCEKIHFLFHNCFFSPLTHKRFWIQVFPCYNCRTSVKLHNLFSALTFSSRKHGGKTDFAGLL